MSDIKYVFLDLDDTLLDFKRSEREAIKGTLLRFGVTPTEELCLRYSEINRDMWRRLERGELARAEMRTARFELLFSELGMRVPAADARDAYEAELAMTAFFLPYAEALLSELFGKYRLYLASNGTAAVQKSRIEISGIGAFFDGIFISELIGHNKPAPEFFEHCFSHIPNFKRDEAIIIGDSLTSDIAGGIGAGIMTCLYNPDGKAIPENLKPSHEIKSLRELPILLEKL